MTAVKYVVGTVLTWILVTWGCVWLSLNLLDAKVEYIALFVTWLVVVVSIGVIAIAMFEASNQEKGDERRRLKEEVRYLETCLADMRRTYETMESEPIPGFVVNEELRNGTFQRRVA